MKSYPTFTVEFLHPRYWLTWFGLAIFYILVLLPYPILYFLGARLGRLSMRFLKRRVHIAQCNLAHCFPEQPQAVRDEWIKENFESVGIALFETGMAWFWPDWRIKRHFKVTGLEHVAKAKANNQGILLIGIHFLTLELGARVLGIYNPAIGVYRPHNNKLMNWVQTKGRTRSNKSMIDRKDLKGMIRALKKGEIIWYAPDHDYGPRSSVFVPLFAVEKAATTAGTYLLAKTAKPAIIPFAPRRLPKGKGYEIIIQPAIEDFPLDDDVTAATAMNKVVERQIMLAPKQYMWLHRRFKTRPEGESSYY